MSLINKMLQDLDKRHAADSGGKTLTQELRPVQGRRSWKRIAWEVAAGLVIGGGWAVWVIFQISPRSVATDLAFQAQPKRLQAAAGVPAAPVPAAPPAVAPASEVPAQAVPSQGPPPAAPPASAAPTQATPSQGPLPPSATAPAATAKSPDSVTLGRLKLTTEIATPIGRKDSGARPRAERKPAAATDVAARTRLKEQPAAEIGAASAPLPKAGAGAVAATAPGAASIDKQPHASTPAEGADNAFRRATVLLNQGRVAEAMDGYRSTLQQDGAHAAARQALVGLLLENRRIDEAQQLLQEGLRLHPDRSAYAMLLARIQVERGDLQGAHDLLSKHAGSAANQADYHAFDAALLQRLGRHKEAVTGYQAALRLMPGASVWWMGMGISLQADNYGAEALEAFRQAKATGALNPDLQSFVDQRMKQLQ